MQLCTNFVLVFNFLLSSCFAHCFLDIKKKNCENRILEKLRSCNHTAVAFAILYKMFRNCELEQCNRLRNSRNKYVLKFNWLSQTTKLWVSFANFSVQLHNMNFKFFALVFFFNVHLLNIIRK